jgi:hypothetical protein
MIDQEMTAAEHMAALEAEAMEEVDLDRDIRERERANKAMIEEGVEMSTALGLTIRVDTSTMHGTGPGGPYLVDAPNYFIEDRTLEMKVRRYPLGAFVYQSLMFVTETFNAIHPTIFMFSLAWSMQGGTAKPDMEQVAAVWNRAIPDWSEVVIDGAVHRISRPPMNPEQVLGELGKVLQEQTTDQVQALYEIVFVALGRFNPEITMAEIRANFDMPLLVRTLAQILAINHRMADRFFE